jgi:polysaccharide transporter, PST family
MSLLKSSFLNGIAVIIKICCAVLINKILAAYVGPTGYAVIGQFQNVLNIATSLAGGVMSPGITKSTAQHFSDEATQHRLWQTAFKLTAVTTACVSVGLIAGNHWFSQVLLPYPGLSNVLAWAAIALPATAANGVLLAIINGKKEITIYATANAIGSVIGLVVIGLMAHMWGLRGALLALAISPAMLLLGTMLLVKRCSWFKFRHLWGSIYRPVLRELSGYGLMGLTAALAGPLAYMFIRSHISSSQGLAAAGYWQASWKLSEIFLLLVTSTLSAYYLPRLAEIRKSSELKAEITKVYFFFLPTVLIGACVMYLSRDFIIDKFFTSEFSPMRDLFAWQLTGDVIKIGSWILSFVMLGRAMVRQFIFTEILFSITFCLLAVIGVNQLGLKGVCVAYAINYALYWATIALILRSEAQRMDART